MYRIKEMNILHLGIYKRLELFLRLIVPLFLLVFSSCRIDEDTIPVTVLSENDDTIYEIKEWMLIGPFTFDTLKQNPLKTYYNVENIQLGFDEKGISDNIFNKLQKGESQPFYANRKNAFLNLFDYVVGKSTDKSNFYSYANIYSAKERKMVMVCDGSSSYSIWLNGDRKVEVIGNKDAYKLASKFVRVKLQKGKNLLFAKINRGSSIQSWKLVVGFTGEKNAQRLYNINYLTDFIYNPLVNNKLTIYAGPYQKGNMIISNDSLQMNYYFRKNDIKDGLINLELPESFTDGFYKCRLNLENIAMDDYFFYGDFNYFLQQKMLTANLNGLKTNVVKELEAINEVFDYYNDTSYWNTIGINVAIQNSVKFEWARNMIETFDYANKHKNLINKSGTTLKAIVDKQTGENKVFLFHVDSTILDAERKFPVILVPVSDSVNKDMIHSQLLGNLSQINTDCKLADIKGFAICWLFLNGKNYSIRNSAEEVQSSLNSLLQDYPMIDTASVFLYGEGIGGSRAMLLAEMQPHKYAGLAAYNPFILPDSIQESPANYGINLVNIYAFILHGQKFEGSTFENFSKFVDKVSKLGMKKLSYEQSKNGKLEFTLNYKLPVFEYFEKVYNILPYRQPYFIRYKTFDNSFNKAHWISYDAINDSSVTELVSRYQPESTRFTFKCKNIKTLKIDASKIGIPIGKVLYYKVNNISKKVTYEKDGNIELSIAASIAR